MIMCTRCGTRASGANAVCEQCDKEMMIESCIADITSAKDNLQSLTPFLTNEHLMHLTDLWSKLGQFLSDTHRARFADPENHD
jgi:hypothetical protein